MLGAGRTNGSYYQEIEEVVDVQYSEVRVTLVNRYNI